MFQTGKVFGIDQILSLMQEFRADPRNEKVDLVVGVYKDAAGDVPVLASVKEAEARILATQTTKTYVGVAGDPAFRQAIAALLLGEDAPQIAEGRTTTLQTPGGTAAVKVGCDMIASLTPENRIWVSTPTWANHAPVAEGAGLEVVSYPYFRAADRRLDFGAMMTHLERHADRGEVILIHACCHNPTGVDLSMAQWTALTDFIVGRGLVPFVDCAYQGFGEGLDEDVAGLRYLAGRVPELMLASSCSKNFAIYSERTGALTLQTETAAQLKTAQSAAENVIRTNYSMPPSHGAGIVTTILSDPVLCAQWQDEVAAMRQRIAEMRTQLRSMLEDRQVTQDVSFLTEQKGMFTYTGFTPDQVARLRDDHGIYMAGDGRVNIAALSPGNLDVVADGFAAVLR